MGTSIADASEGHFGRQRFFRGNPGNDTDVNLSISFTERLDGRNSFDAPEDGDEKPYIVFGIPQH